MLFYISESKSRFFSRRENVACGQTDSAREMMDFDDQVFSAGGSISRTKMWKIPRLVGKINFLFNTKKYVYE